MNKPEYDECVQMLRSTDPMTYEDGYHWLQGSLEIYIDELSQLMFSEADPEMRSKLVELVGNFRNPKVIPLLAAELESPYSEVRSWAYSLLCYFENPEAERFAEKFREGHPSENFL